MGRHHIASGFQCGKYVNLAVMLSRIFAILLSLSFFAIFGDTSFGDSLAGRVPAKAQRGATQGSVLLEKKEVSLLEDKAYYDALLAKVNGAKSNVLISMYLFTTTGRKENSANKIKEALVKAAKRGVHVKVLLELEGGQSSSLNKENRHTADGLTKGGGERYFDLPRQRTHVKAVVIDSRYTFIGSH